MIWLALNRDVFMGNPLELGCEKIPLLTTALFRGDYHVRLVVCAPKVIESTTLESALDRRTCSPPLDSAQSANNAPVKVVSYAQTTN
jgi:hypothetical protein